MKDVFFKVERVASKAVCHQLCEAFEIVKKEGINIDPLTPESNRADHSFGFGTNFSPFQDLAKAIEVHLLPLLQPGEKIQYSHCYTREYYSGGGIKRHVDLNSDITVSLCIKRVLNQDWPLVADIDGQVVSLSADVGDALVLTNVRSVQHWRGPLFFSDEESQIQVFYLWKITS